MTTTIAAHARASVVALCLIGALLPSCGGGGDGGAAGGGGNQPPPPGDTPTSVPTDTPVPTPIIVFTGDITAALRQAAPGTTVIVPPGSYAPVTLQPGDLQGPVTLIADVTGILTGSIPSPATISAGVGVSAAIALTEQNGLTIDGFTLVGGTDAAVLVSGGSGIVVRNCSMSHSTGDGMRISASSDALVFNNLIFRNSGTGLAVLGADGIRVINNTVFGNADRGIFIGADSGQDSSDTLLRNNIINSNFVQGTSPQGIVAEAPSLAGYDGDYDLNTDTYIGVIAGVHDVDSDPLFISPGGTQPNLHVVGPDLLGGGSSPAIDAGDPDTDPDLVAVLEQGTVDSNMDPDVPPVDLGYHFPLQGVVPTQPVSTATARRATATSTRPSAPTSTRTATRPAGPTSTPTRGPSSTPNPHKPTPTTKPTATPRAP